MDSDAVASAQPTMPGPPIVCSAERESSFLDISASSEGWHVQWESVPSGQESEPCNLGRICGGNEADEAD